MRGTGRGADAASVCLYAKAVVRGWCWPIAQEPAWTFPQQLGTQGFGSVLENLGYGI